MVDASRHPSQTEKDILDKLMKREPPVPVSMIINQVILRSDRSMKD